MKERWHLPENDALINALILLCSYLLLFLMPAGEKFGGYLLLAVSAFLFCIGYFRLIAVLPVPKEQRTAMRWEKMAAFLGIAVVLLGCLVVPLRVGLVVEAETRAPGLNFIRLTRLGSWRVVWGQWLSGALQVLVLAGLMIGSVVLAAALSQVF